MDSGVFPLEIEILPDHPGAWRERAGKMAFTPMNTKYTYAR
jgi:hypothetical protein